MRSKLFVLLIIILAFMLLAVEPTFAQCPMCRTTAESSLKEGSTVALGLNRGILYLLSMPYLLFSVIFLLWYWNFRKNKVVVN